MDSKYKELLLTYHLHMRAWKFIHLMYCLLIQKCRVQPKLNKSSIWFVNLGCCCASVGSIREEGLINYFREPRYASCVESCMFWCAVKGIAKNIYKTLLFAFLRTPQKACLLPAGFIPAVKLHILPCVGIHNVYTNVIIL